MPLSEHEQKLLDQLEQQLHADDPQFVSSMASESVGRKQAFVVRNIVSGTLLTLLGLAVIIVGVATKLIVIGLGGFLLAAGGIYLATLRQEGAKKSRPAAQPSKVGKSQASFMRGLEEKWEERRNQGF